MVKMFLCVNYVEKHAVNIEKHFFFYHGALKQERSKNMNFKIPININYIKYTD